MLISMIDLSLNKMRKLAEETRTITSSLVRKKLLQAKRMASFQFMGKLFNNTYFNTFDNFTAVLSEHRQYGTLRCIAFKNNSSFICSFSSNFLVIVENNEIIFETQVFIGQGNQRIVTLGITAVVYTGESYYIYSKGTQFLYRVYFSKGICFLGLIKCDDVNDSVKFPLCFDSELGAILLKANPYQLAIYEIDTKKQKKLSYSHVCQHSQNEVGWVLLSGGRIIILNEMGKLLYLKYSLTTDKLDLIDQLTMNLLEGEKVGDLCISSDSKLVAVSSSYKFKRKAASSLFFVSVCKNHMTLSVHFWFRSAYSYFSDLVFNPTVTNGHYILHLLESCEDADLITVFYDNKLRKIIRINSNTTSSVGNSTKFITYNNDIIWADFHNKGFKIKLD